MTAGKAIAVVMVDARVPLPVPDEVPEANCVLFPEPLSKMIPEVELTALLAKYPSHPVVSLELLLLNTPIRKSPAVDEPVEMPDIVQLPEKTIVSPGLVNVIVANPEYNDELSALSGVLFPNVGDAVLAFVRMALPCPSAQGPMMNAAFAQGMERRAAAQNGRILIMRIEA
ncbi:MAG: hypothetical protein V4733_12440 [Verrucomicrobiota bacterium]